MNEEEKETKYEGRNSRKTKGTKQWGPRRRGPRMKLTKDKGRAERKTKYKKCEVDEERSTRGELQRTN